MSSTDRPTLSFCVNAAPAPESACETAEGTSSAIVARKSRPACMRALTRLYSWTWYLSPPSRNDAPSMNSELVTIAPAMDAFTSMYCPARSAVERDDQFRQVSQRGVEQPADRVARLGGHGFGGVTQQRRQRHDRQHGQHEMQRVRFGLELLRREHQRARRPAATAACCDGFRAAAGSWLSSSRLRTAPKTLTMAGRRNIF